MLMYHKNSKQPVDVHPSQVETMKNRGWTVKPAKSSTKQEKENGN